MTISKVRLFIDKRDVLFNAHDTLGMILFVAIKLHGLCLKVNRFVTIGNKQQMNEPLYF